ncbi:RING-box protein 1 [Yarrowia sp. C11]|nr:RING-box protein 1 [Yarrowia sp. E02]KAG5372614.1 RING-box protein 1 [Yarrowia sp. C11]
MADPSAMDVDTPVEQVEEVVEKPKKSAKKRLEVKKWSAVAFWSWDIQVETCAICKNHIMEPCIDCQANASGTQADCNVAWGKCNHAFHFHCINRWLKSRNTCPLDSKDWEFTRYGQ